MGVFFFFLLFLLPCLWSFHEEKGFTGGSESKESTCNAGDLGLIPGLRRYSGEGNGNPPVFLPGESHGQRSLAGYSPWDYKELNKTEQLTLFFFF